MKRAYVTFVQNGNLRGAEIDHEPYDNHLSRAQWARRQLILQRKIFAADHVNIQTIIPLKNKSQVAA